MASRHAGAGHRFAELQSLRAILALWVLAAHLVEEFGVPLPNHDVFRRVIFNGGLAVDGFIILSGFVIAWSLIERPRPYRLFLLDRAVRLLPVLWFSLAVSLLVLAVASHQGAERFAALPLARYVSQVGDALWLHILLHMTMLHGLVPDQVLANSALAILPPAWSISLEWQFYLVAPALLAWIGMGGRLRAGRLLLLILATTVLAWVVWKTLSFGNKAAFLPLRLGWFLFGAACAVGWKGIGEAGGDTRALLLVVIAAAVPFFRSEALLPILLWAVTLWAASGEATGFVGAGFRMRWLQAIGEASYSLYLVQLPMIWLTLVVAATLGITIADAIPVLVVSAVGVTAAGTAASYAFIEKPALRWWERARSGRRGVHHQAAE
jgi:peptidoglycan/LPS O-acetylase OafA/YrhL